MSSTAKRQSAIARIWELLSQPIHPYRPATTIFLDLNVDRVADELELVAKGKARGTQNRPTADAQTLDDVEHRVIERVETHKQTANSIYLDQVHTYDDRASALSFEQHFSIIQQAAPEAVGDFAAEAGIGRDELFGLRRRLWESEVERDQFRARHRIERPARLASLGKIVLKIGILAVLFVIEVAVNAGFLSESNFAGYLGGATQAVVFATLNIIASFLWGLVLIRLVHRRNLFLKFIGIISFVAYAAFALALNLALAHLREIPPTISGNPGQEVLHRLFTTPYILTDIKSWILFAVGLIFSLASMADGLMFFDPYIGYAGLERRWIEASKQLAQARINLIERLRDIREDATDAMHAAARDLSVRRGEYDSLLLGRNRLSQLFTQHQNQIEQAGRALLEMYREANRATRSAKTPAYFAKPYVMERITYASSEPDQGAPEHLRKTIAETQELLKTQVAAIQAAFNSAVESYGEIDKLFAEKKSG
jgi:hypothetical protein